MNIKEQIKNVYANVQDDRDAQLAELYYHRGYQKGHDDTNTHPQSISEEEIYDIIVANLTTKIDLAKALQAAKAALKELTNKTEQL